MSIYTNNIKNIYQSFFNQNDFVLNHKIGFDEEIEYKGCESYCLECPIKTFIFRHPFHYGSYIKVKICKSHISDFLNEYKAIHDDRGNFVICEMYYLLFMSSLESLYDFEFEKVEHSFQYRKNQRQLVNYAIGFNFYKNKWVQIKLTDLIKMAPNVDDGEKYQIARAISKSLKFWIEETKGFSKYITHNINIKKLCRKIEDESSHPHKTNSNILELSEKLIIYISKNLTI